MNKTTLDLTVPITGCLLMVSLSYDHCRIITAAASDSEVALHLDSDSGERA